MSTHRGIQGFIESKAEGPAFAIVAASMILRASQFYSGGQLVLAHLLGTFGMAVFNMASGIGLAFGCELLASVAGRQWRTNSAEAFEARGRSGMKRAERDALVARFESQARIAKRYMWIGLLASFGAAFWYVASGSTSHDLASIGGETLVTALLVSVVSYFGIFKDSAADDPTQETTARAVTIRGGIVEAAGRRIAGGDYTPQDVRIVAKALPKVERERFEAALLPPSADDPHWSTRDIAAWLGCDDGAGRKQVTRKLAKLLENGAGVMRDDKGAYTVPRSVVIMHFADDYLRIHAAGGERRTPSASIAAGAGTSGSHHAAPIALGSPTDGDIDGRMSGQGPTAGPASVPALAFAGTLSSGPGSMAAPVRTARPA